MLRLGWWRTTGCLSQWGVNFTAEVELAAIAEVLGRWRINLRGGLHEVVAVAVGWKGRTALWRKRKLGGVRALLPEGEGLSFLKEWDDLALVEPGEFMRRRWKSEEELRRVFAKVQRDFRLERLGAALGGG